MTAPRLLVNYNNCDNDFRLLIGGKVWNYVDEPSHEVVSFFQSRRRYCLTVKDLSHEQRRDGIPREFDCGNAICQLTNSSCERHMDCPIHSIYCKDCDKKNPLYGSCNGNPVHKHPHPVSYSFPYYLLISDDVHVRNTGHFIMHWFIHAGTRYGYKLGLFLISRSKNKGEFGEYELPGIFAGAGAGDNNNNENKIASVVRSRFPRKEFKKVKDKTCSILAVEDFKFKTIEKQEWCWLKNLNTGQNPVMLMGEVDVRSTLPITLSTDVDGYYSALEDDRRPQIKKCYSVCVIDRYIGPPDKTPRETTLAANFIKPKPTPEDRQRALQIRLEKKTQAQLRRVKAAYRRLGIPFEDDNPEKVLDGKTSHGLLGQKRPLEDAFSPVVKRGGTSHDERLKEPIEQPPMMNNQ